MKLYMFNDLDFMMKVYRNIFQQIFAKRLHFRKNCFKFNDDNLLRK